MNRSNKRKFAVTLLGALAFGANAQAKDLNKNQIVKTNDFQVNSTSSVQNSGKLGQVTGIVKEANWGKRALVITVGSLLGLETVHSIIGAATDSKLGSYSIGRAIKNYAKKDKQPGGPGEQGKKNPGKKIDNTNDDETAEDKDKDKDKEKENLDDIKKITNISIQNQQQSMNVMSQMVNKIPQNLPDVQKFGIEVLGYLAFLIRSKLNNLNSYDAEYLSYVASGKGVITNCNYFCDHNIWCFGIEVTYNENNGTKKGYVYLAPCMSKPDGQGGGVKVWATADFQDRLVEQWPDNKKRGPSECGNFILQ